MEIQEQTPHKLTIVDDSLANMVITIIFSIVLVIAPFLVMPSIFPRRSILTCNRVKTTSIDCHIELSILEIKFRDISLKQLQAAQLVEREQKEYGQSYKTNRNLPSYHYEIWLQTDKEIIPFVVHDNKYFPRPKFAENVLQINNFIKDPTKTILTISIDTGERESLIFVRFFLGISLIIILLRLGVQPVKVTYIFDKTTNKITQSNKYIWGTIKNEHLLNDISEIFIERAISNNRRSIKIQIVISTNSLMSSTILSVFSWNHIYDLDTLLKNIKLAISLSEFFGANIPNLKLFDFELDKIPDIELKEQRLTSTAMVVLVNSDRQPIYTLYVGRKRKKAQEFVELYRQLVNNFNFRR